MIKGVSNLNHSPTIGVHNVRVKWGHPCPGDCPDGDVNIAGG